MSILTESAHRLGRSVLEALLPQDCMLCGSASGAELLCAACDRELPRLPAHRCPQCALPTPDGERCGRCLTQAPHFDATLAVFRYDFPIDKLVQAYKYGQQLALAGYFVRQFSPARWPPDADLLLALPLHAKRLRARGYNQALEIARPLARRTGTPLATAICTRSRDTPPQADLRWRERVKNIRNAFDCTTDLSGKHIVLVDDVLTTGASVGECARTLKLHGAARVTVAVVARAIID